jgi:4-hydroxy-tetrahydrodipicolinate synthase
MIQAFDAGQTGLATEIHLKLFPLFKVLFCTANPIPLKAALKLQGWTVGSPRPPLCELPTELQQGIEDVLIELSLL